MHRERDLGDVGAGLGLGEREGGDAAARPHTGQHRLALGRRAGQRQRPGAEALHGEGEIGEAVVAGEGLAQEAERPHVEHPVLGGGEAQEPRLAERRDEPPARAVDVVVVDEGRHRAGGPVVGLRGEVAVPRLEERPVEEGPVGHGQGLPTWFILPTTSS